MFFHLLWEASAPPRWPDRVPTRKARKVNFWPRIILGQDFMEDLLRINRESLGPRSRFHPKYCVPIKTGLSNLCVAIAVPCIDEVTRCVVFRWRDKVARSVEIGAMVTCIPKWEGKELIPDLLCEKKRMSCVSQDTNESMGRSDRSSKLLSSVQHVASFLVDTFLVDTGPTLLHVLLTPTHTLSRTPAANCLS